MTRLTGDYPASPIPGAEALGKYPLTGSNDERMEWVARYQRAAQGIPEFPTADADALELEYLRLTADNVSRREIETADENEMLRAAGRPDYIASLISEKVMAHIEGFVAAIVKRFTAGVVMENLLPRIESIKEAAATLPAIEKRQLELETRLRLLVALLNMGEEMSRCEAMHEREEL